MGVIQRANMPSRLLICASVLAVLLCHTWVSAEVTPNTIVPERGLDSLKSQILRSNAHEVPAAALSSDVVNKANGDEDSASSSEDELWSIGGMAQKAKDKANELKDKVVRKANELKDKAVKKAEEIKDAAVRKAEEKADEDKDSASGSEDELWSYKQLVKKANELKDKAVKKADEIKDEAVRKAEEKADEDTAERRS